MESEYFDYKSHGTSSLGNIINEDAYSKESGQLVPNYYYKGGIVLFDTNQFRKFNLKKNETVSIIVFEKGILFPISEFSQFDFEITSIIGIFNSQIKKIKITKKDNIETLNPRYLLNVFKVSGSGFLGSICTMAMGSIIENVLQERTIRVKGFEIIIEFEDYSSALNRATFEISEAKTEIINTFKALNKIY